MGWPLTVLSVQNEPGMNVDYESCLWTGAQLRDFIKVLGDRFALKGVQSSLGLKAPEDENFKETEIVSALGDSKAKAILTHVGVHQYEAPWDSNRLGAEKLTQTSAAGKRIWETEMGETNSGKTATFPKSKEMNNALMYARLIHYDLTLAEVSAWLYWWLWSYNNPDSDGLVYIDSSGRMTLAKRFFAVGHFSKFVRPGWQRVGSTTQSAAKVLTSAYKNPQNKDIALVLINYNDTPAQVNLKLQGGRQFKAFSAAWRSSETEEFEPVALPVAGAAQAAYTLPANSITTILGSVE